MSILKSSKQLLIFQHVRINCLQKRKQRQAFSLEMYKLVKIIDSSYNSNSVKSIQVDFT